VSSTATLNQRFMEMITTPTADPRPFYAELRERAPVFRTPYGFWYVTSYQLGVKITRDPYRWFVDPARSSTARPAHEVGSYALRVWHNSIQYADGNSHKRLRRLVNALFAPSAVARLRETVEAVVGDELDRLDGFDEVELKRQFAHRLPTRVIVDLLGLDSAELDHFIELSDSIAAALEPGVSAQTLRRADGVWRSAADAVRVTAAKRRADPRDDLLSSLVSARDDDSVLSDDELVSLVLALAVAGQETTANMLCNAVYHLLIRPDHLHELRRDRGLLPGAIEELVRYEPSPRNAVARYAAEDIEVGGVPIAKGEAVYVGNQAANHDPAEFRDPLVVDLRRNPNRHLGFGTGAHHCLGAALARLELSVALDALLTRYSRIELAVPDVRWHPGFVLRALEALPLRVATS